MSENIQECPRGIPNFCMWWKDDLYDQLIRVSSPCWVYWVNLNMIYSFKFYISSAAGLFILDSSFFEGPYNATRSVGVIVRKFLLSLPDMFTAFSGLCWLLKIHPRSSWFQIPREIWLSFDRTKQFFVLTCNYVLIWLGFWVGVDVCYFENFMFHFRTHSTELASSGLTLASRTSSVLLLNSLLAIPVS